MAHQRDRLAQAMLLPCLCGNLRRAARLVSMLYESEPGWPKDMSIAQASLLQGISRSRTITQAGLGWLLGLDQTTLSRSLAILKKRGLIKIAQGEDRRARQLTLTDKGKQMLQQLEPARLRAQARLRRRYGAAPWRKLERSLTILASLTALPSSRDRSR